MPRKSQRNRVIFLPCRLQTSIFSQKLERMFACVASAILLAIAMPDTTASDRVDLSGIDSQQTYEQFIVKYRNGSAARASSAELQSSLDKAASSLSNRDGKKLTLRSLRRLAVQADVVRSNRKLDRVDAESLMRAIAVDPDIEYVEIDALMKPFFTPNDTRYGEQWHYFESTGGLNLPPAWDKSTGNGVVIAVLDTGITNHSDLNANVITGYDFISDLNTAGDGDGRDLNPNDPGDYVSNGGGGCGVPPCFYPQANSSWHGTHVAGTVAASTNNSKGVAGVAFNAKVSPVRVLGRGGGYVSDVSDAIVWASGGVVNGVPNNRNPAEVVNMSLGGGGSCSATYQQAINSAVSRGTTVVVSAGNSNSNAGNFQPASCNNVIAVAATDRQGNRASYSNYGALIDVSAPGGEGTSSNGVLSALNTGATVPLTETYGFYQGTSMAAPHVAGLVALIQSRSGVSKSPAQIEALLKDTARALPGACPEGCGSGIVDANAALDATENSVVRNDIDGGGKSDVLFHNPTLRQFSYRIMNGSTVVRSEIIDGVGSGYTVAATGDFNGDSKLDLIWTSAARDLYMWTGNGTTFSSVNFGSYPSGWSVAGAGDVDGDGKSDVLFHNPTLRQFSYRIMNGSTVVRSEIIDGVGSGYTVAATGDFNGDGKLDLIWTSAARDLYMWTGNGTTFSSINFGNYPSGWSIVH